VTRDGRRPTLWAISDLHTGHTGNKPITESIHPSTPDDWLIVAGDVAERTDEIYWALDLLRRPREVEIDANHEEMVASIPDESPGPEELLKRSIEAGALAECMKQLTGDQQRSIALAFFNGLSHGELARQMQKPLGTVKTWIRRGLERLKSCLDAQGI